MENLITVLYCFSQSVPEFFEPYNRIAGKNHQAAAYQIQQS
jgi:hypothetical protein